MPERRFRPSLLLLGPALWVLVTLNLGDDWGEPLSFARLGLACLVALPPALLPEARPGGGRLARGVGWTVGFVVAAVLLFLQGTTLSWNWQGPTMPDVQGEIPFRVAHAAALDAVVALAGWLLVGLVARATATARGWLGLLVGAPLAALVGLGLALDPVAAPVAGHWSCGGGQEVLLWPDGSAAARLVDADGRVRLHSRRPDLVGSLHNVEGYGPDELGVSLRDADGTQPALECRRVGEPPGLAWTVAGWLWAPERIGELARG